MRAANTNRQPMPPHDAHTDTRHGMRLDIPHPPIHDLSIRIKSLNSARMYAPLEILLRLFVRERPSGHRPERTACRQGYDA
jgi:hypothetical protein